MKGDLTLCGWRVRSELALPELLPWHDNLKPVDIEISFGAIPSPTPPPLFQLPHSKLWANGCFLLHLEAVGKFWVENGRRIILEPARNADESELRTFLLGSVLGVLCHQRGLLPVHASATRVNGGSVLIAGDSGSGKSTLAAALGARGHALVADDISAFDARTAMLLPAFPLRKLSSDVLDKLSLPHQGLIANRPGQPKFHVPAANGFTPVPLPPSVIYVLHSDRRVKGVAIERTSPAMAMTLLDRMIYRRAVGMKIQSRQSLFLALSTLAGLAPVYRLRRESGLSLDHLDSLAERVEAHAYAIHAQKTAVKAHLHPGTSAE